MAQEKNQCAERFAFTKITGNRSICIADYHIDKMNEEKFELTRSYIEWMRKRITLSLDGYYSGWEDAPRVSIGVPVDRDDDTCAPSIGKGNFFRRPFSSVYNFKAVIFISLYFLGKDIKDTSLIEK